MTISKETAGLCLGLLAQVPFGSIGDDQFAVVLAARNELQAVLAAADEEPAP